MNCRIKDFYDIYVLIERQLLDRSRLKQAINQTFKRRQTPIPKTLPIALSEDFLNDESKAKKQWSAFLQNIEYTDVPQNGKEVIQTIKTSLWPITEELHSKKVLKMLFQEWDILFRFKPMVIIQPNLKNE